MRLPSIFRSTLVSLLATSAVPFAGASPLVSVGDNTDIFFDGSSSLRWSSNIFRANQNVEEDLIWSVTPGFRVDLGRGATNADFSILTQYEIRRYFDLDELDTELFNVRLNGSYRSSRLDLGGSAFFQERKASTGDINLVNDLIESDVMGGRVDGEYRVSPKFSFGAGLKYNETNYKEPFDNQFADRERFDIPLDVFYELTPKVDLSVGYAYSETDVEATPTRPNSFTTEDHFVNVGARGNLLPKLTGFFKVGYRTRDSDRANFNSDSTLGIDSDFTWAATPKLTTRLNLSRDFGVGGEGVSNENTSVGLTANYAINQLFGATAFTNYNIRDYQNDREDNQFRLGARLNYTPNRYWRFGLGYTYSENDSDDPTRANPSARSFEDHTIGLTASFRY